MSSQPFNCYAVTHLLIGWLFLLSATNAYSAGGSITIVLTSGAGSTLGVQVFSGASCTVGSQNATVSPAGPGTYTASWSLTALSYKVLGGSWTGCSGYTGPCTGGDPNGMIFTFTAGNCTPTGTNDPCFNTYPQQSCWTNNLDFSVLAIPVVSNTGGSPGTCNCLTPGPYQGYSLAPKEVACFNPGTPQCPWVVNWDIWFGGNGNTNTPPYNGGTNGPGTNGGVIFPPKGDWPAPGSGGGPTNLPPGSGQGSTTNLTGGQFATGIGGLGNIIWQGDQGIIGAINGQTGTGGTGGTGTNGLGLYSSNSVDGVYPSYGTNAGNGSAAAGDATNFLTSAVSSTNTASGSSSGLSFAFAGSTINLDPESVMPGVPGVIKTLLGWGATIWFLFWFANEYQKTVQSMASAELGGVPDLEVLLAGFGGNLVGVTSALVVPLVFLGLWVGVFTYGFSFGLSSIGVFSANPFNGAIGSGTGTSGQIAMYLLQDLMPLPYLLSLIWARITLAFTMAKLAGVSAAAGRFLFGK